MSYGMPGRVESETFVWDTDTLSWVRAEQVDVTSGAASVVVTSSALPSGAATAARQDTGNTALSVIDDWDESDRAKVNPIAGQTGVQAGAGTVSANTVRVALATDAATVQPGNTPNTTPWLANPSTSFGKTITYVSVAQGAAGTTQLAAADATKKHKVVGALLTMSLAGTLKFTDGAGDLTGPIPLALNGGFVIPTGPLPLVQTTTTNTALSIVTTVGAASGVVAILTEV